MVSQDFGTFNTRPEKFVGRDCDVINKVAYKPFPNWKVSWPRSDFTISLSKFAERKPTIEVSSKLGEINFSANTSQRRILSRT